MDNFTVLYCILMCKVCVLVGQAYEIVNEMKTVFKLTDCSIDGQHENLVQIPKHMTEVLK